MTDDTLDYGSPVPENGGIKGTISEDGTVDLKWEPASERDPGFNKWHGSQRIQALPDSAIIQVQTRKNGVVDYKIEDVSVSYHPKSKGKRKWLCHTHICNWCPCVKRVRRFREDHPSEVAAA